MPQTGQNYASEDILRYIQDLEERIKSLELKEQVPAGTILPYGGQVAPPGFLICDGLTYSRTIYANLFAVIGTFFGVGDNLSTFNVPNLKGKFPFGIGDALGLAIGAVGGEITHLLTGSESGLPLHNHTASSAGDSPDHTHGPGSLATQHVSTSGAGSTGGPTNAIPPHNSLPTGQVVTNQTTTGATGGISINHTHGITVNNIAAANAASAHNNMPPYVAVNYIIAAI